MTSKSIRTNRHPVDRMADIRREIRALQEEEATLRELILAHPGDMRGDEYQAEIERKTIRSLNRKRLAARFGRKKVAACCDERTTLFVYVRKRR